MDLRVVFLLFMGVVLAAKCDEPRTDLAVKCDQFASLKTNPGLRPWVSFEACECDDLMDVVKRGLTVIRDLFNIIIGKAIFRDILTAAADLTASFFPLRPLPRVPEPWWGDRPDTDTSIKPFKVVFSDQMISDLRGRIIHRRQVTPSLGGSANTYGTNAGYLEQLLDYWAHDYEFGKREEWLNSFLQYTTKIQGLSIHYIHVKPPNPRHKKVLPLLLLHGWPVTAFEYVHVIEHLLIERGDFVFEIIAPDLPGYGYSEATNKIGLNMYQTGIIMKNLMKRLGHPRFYIHAGDLGQLVADSMAVLFPGRVLGLHTNLAFSWRPQTLVKHLLGQLYPRAVVEERYEDRMYPLAARARSYLENTGYFHMQAAKPDNIGHGTDDSPIAQIAWLFENIITGAGVLNQLTADGNFTKLYDARDWFDSFTVYWDSRCMTTSVRLYAEFLAVLRDPLTVTILTTPTPVPFAAIRFRYEIIYQPDDFLQDKYPNLVHSTTLDFGGHFAGYQDPGVLADSIRTSVGKMELFHKSQGAVKDAI